MATRSADAPLVIQRHWTAAEYRRLPEGPPYYELEDGRLIEWPLRSGTHQTIVGRLLIALARYLDHHPLGEVWPAVAVELTPTRTYIPDLSFLQVDNLSRFADGIAIQGPPDLVVEVVSPSTAGRDKVDKFHAYHQAGVPWYWLVESDIRVITEFRYKAEGYLVNQTANAADTFIPPLFPGLSFRMADLIAASNLEEESP